MAGDVTADDRALEAACAQLVRKVWEDEDYAASVVANPRESLADNGWTAPEGVEVDIELIEPEAFAEESARATEGAQGGDGGEPRSLTLKLPSSPLDSAKLSDEQLEAVSGGEGDLGYGGHLLRNWS
jgi:hypothetical protein